MDDNFKEERMLLDQCYKRMVLSVVILIVLCALGYILSSCTTTQYIPVETVHTEYIAKHDSVVMKDSVFLYDSVFVHAKGDTVWLEKWHTQYKDRTKEVVKTDTVIKNDSIQISYPVERKLSKWEQTKIDYGGKAIIFTLLILYIIIWLIVEKLRR